MSSSASAGGGAKSVASSPFSNWTASTHTAPPGGPVRELAERWITTGIDTGMSTART